VTVIPFPQKPQPAAMGDECDCATCRSDLARLLPCDKEDDDDAV